MSGTGLPPGSFEDETLPATTQTFVDASTGQTLSVPSSNEPQTYNIYLNAAGKYYAATSAVSGNDSLIPNPSADMYHSLVANALASGPAVSPITIEDEAAALGNGEATQFTNDGVQ